MPLVHLSRKVYGAQGEREVTSREGTVNTRAGRQELLRADRQNQNSTMKRNNKLTANRGRRTQEQVRRWTGKVWLGMGVS